MARNCLSKRKRAPSSKIQGLAYQTADFFSRAKLLPAQQPALADFDFILVQQSPLQSPDLEQQATFMAVWSFASGCALP